jgi:hypothetical protein
MIHFVRIVDAYFRSADGTSDWVIFKQLSLPIGRLLWLAPFFTLPRL